MAVAVRAPRDHTVGAWDWKGLPMAFKLALAQCAHPGNGDVLGLVQDWVKRAVLADADMLVFPEGLMTPFEKEPEEYMASAQMLTGGFSRAVDEIIREQGIWTIYTMNEKNLLTEGKPYNTAVVAGPDGNIRDSYRKVHLFDSGDYSESSKMSPGNRIFVPFDVPFCRFGLGICYDLRFPELARKQALDGCDIMIYPSAWVDGPGKVDQWVTLLRARAIENGIYTAGVCRVGDGYIGNSLVASPTGEVLAQAGTGEELLLCRIDINKVKAAQEAIPTLKDRRPELYADEEE